MRILQITPSLYSGGGETFSFQLSEALVRRGHDVLLLSIAAPDVESPLYQRLSGVNFEFKSLLKTNGGGVDPFIPFKILELSRQWKPDVIHTHLRALAYSMLTTLSAARKVHTVHSLAEKECGRLTQKLYSGLFRWGWTPVSISEAVRLSVERIYGLSSCLVENGVEIRPGSHAEVRAFRSEIEVEENEKIVVNIGRLTETKDQLLLLAAFERLARSIPDVHLVCVGNDPTAGQGYHTQLVAKRDAMSAEICKRIHFLGLRSDVGVILSASDIFVLCSRYEGLPLSLLEAMALGKRCVCTAVGGIPDAVDTDSAWLLKDRDPVNLASAIKDALEQGGLAKGQRAQERFNSRFSIDKCALGYENLYFGKTPI